MVLQWRTIRKLVCSLYFQKTSTNAIIMGDWMISICMISTQEERISPSIANTHKPLNSSICNLQMQKDIYKLQSSWQMESASQPIVFSFCYFHIEKKNVEGSWCGWWLLTQKVHSLQSGATQYLDSHCNTHLTRFRRLAKNERLNDLSPWNLKPCTSKTLYTNQNVKASMRQLWYHVIVMYAKRSNKKPTNTQTWHCITEWTIQGLHRSRYKQRLKLVINNYVTFFTIHLGSCPRSGGLGLGKN